MTDGMSEAYGQRRGHDENCEYDCKDPSCQPDREETRRLRCRWASLKGFVEMQFDINDFHIDHGYGRSKRLARTRKSAIRAVLEMMKHLEEG